MKSALAKYRSNKLLITFIDYLFWVLLIIYTDPGGLLSSFNDTNMSGSIKIYDLLIILLSFCYIVIPKDHNIEDKDFIKIKKYLIFFLLYYFLVFGYMVPIINGVKDYSFKLCFIKSRTTIFNILLFIYIYEFFKRRWDIFLQVFLFSSVFILIIFILGIITGVNVLPVELMERGFVKINRNLMLSYGLMPLLIPLGVVVIVFNLRIRFKNLILIGFSLMAIAWLVSITRRHIIGIFIYFILAIVINSFITGNFIMLFNKALKGALIIFFITVTAFFVFPKIVEAAKVGIVETFNIVETGKESSGYKDERLGFGRPFIVMQFVKHPLFGTGFDDRWRGGPQGEEQGYKASDYPFLASLAMFGIIGNIVFLPVYIFLFVFLKNDLKYLRNNENENKSLLYLFLLTFILYFTWGFFQYWNYFLPVSNLNIGSFCIWYLFLAFYLGARQSFYSAQYQNKILRPNYHLN